MKDKSKLALELFITLLIASIVSSVISLGFGTILKTLNMADNNAMNYVNMLAALAWGMYVGYKVKSLIEQHRA